MESDSEKRVNYWSCPSSLRKTEKTICSMAAAEGEWWAGALHAATGAETSSHSDTSNSRGAVQVHEDALGLFPSQCRCVTSPFKLVVSSLRYILVVILFYYFFNILTFTRFFLICVNNRTEADHG